WTRSGSGPCRAARQGPERSTRYGVPTPGSTSAVVDDVRQHGGNRAYRDSGPAFTRVPPCRTGVECGPRDIEMRPGQILGDELPQENTCDEHSGPALSRDIGEIRHFGIQIGAELLGKRHRP